MGQIIDNSIYSPIREVLFLFYKTSVDKAASQAGLLELKGKILPLDTEKLLTDQEAAWRPQLMRRPQM